jgi:kumamolisin
MSDVHNDRRAVAGSERTPLPGAERGDEVPANEEATVTVMLRRPAGQAAPSFTTERVSREQFAAEHGAAGSDVEQVEAFAAANGLRVSARICGRTCSR